MEYIWNERTSSTDLSSIESPKQRPHSLALVVNAVRTASNLLTRSYLKLWHGLEIVGRENLPERGSFVMIANHTSHLDTLCLLAALPLGKVHRVHPAAAADYFFATPSVSLASTVLLNALPFDRQDDSQGSLDRCRTLLVQGDSGLIFFPEGTRSTDGRTQRFRSGIARLVAGTDVPVVPCYLDGCAAAFPKGARLPRPRKLRLILGPPRRFPASARSPEAMASICRELSEAVARLPSQALRADRHPNGT